MGTPLRDNLRWAIPGTLLALVLYASNTLWGGPGVLVAVLLVVIGPVVAVTILALRSARGKEPKKPAA